MKIRIACWIVIASFCLAASGCQKTESAPSNRRAQLVGQENLLLKKQIGTSKHNSLKKSKTSRIRSRP